MPPDPLPSIDEMLARSEGIVLRFRQSASELLEMSVITDESIYDTRRLIAEADRIIAGEPFSTAAGNPIRFRGVCTSRPPNQMLA